MRWIYVSACGRNSSLTTGVSPGRYSNRGQDYQAFKSRLVNKSFSHS